MATGKEETILKTAIRLFSSDGVRQTTMDGVAGQSSVSKVTVYKYYQDKETLCLAAGNRVLSTAAAALEGVACSTDGLWKKLRRFIDCVSGFAGSGEHGFCLEFARSNEMMGEALEQYRRVYRATLLSLIDEGIKTRLIKRHLDREVVFRYIDMGIFYYERNPDYRARLASDAPFRESLMRFLIGNLFVSGDPSACGDGQ